MKKNHLADLELDIHELAYLLETLAVTPDQKLKNIAKRNILRIREQLDSLYEELDSGEENEPEEKPVVTSLASVEEEKEEEILSAEEEVPETSVPADEEEEEESEEEEEPEEEELLPDDEDDLIDESDTQSGEEQKEEVAESHSNGLKNNIKAHWQQKYFTEEKKSTTPLKQIISLSDSFYFSRIIFNGETGKLFRLLEEMEEIGTADKAIENYLGYFSGSQSEEEREAFIDLGARVYGWFRDKEK